MAKKKKKAGKNTAFLIVTCGVLVTALTVCAILLLGNAGAADGTQRVIELGTALQGVSVGGIDISGKTKEEALAATANLPAQLLGEADFTVDVQGEQKILTADDLALSTDYEDVIDKAMAYGRTGAFDERLAAAATAKETGVDFPVDVIADETRLAAALAALRVRLDVAPVDATVKFTPNGHLADGSEYDPSKWDEDNDGEPPLVMLPADEYPNALRYEYYNDDHYETGLEDKIPEEAYISRFFYTQEQTGIDVDLIDLAVQIKTALQNDDTSIIAAKTTVTEAAVTVEILKSETQLVSSWTSSYRKHASANRVFNVNKLCGIINGQKIEPGVEWSINEVAGPRTVANGWKEADGIADGGYSQQAGGGVCQISSTLFNASIRSGIFYNSLTDIKAADNSYKWGIEVTSWKHHSIISEYIPLGLDATISTGGPDLKLLNHCTTPFYIVAYMNTAEKCVTVEIYGQTVVHPEYGEVILGYDFKDLGTYGTPVMSTYYDQTQTPDGKPLAAGEQRTYAQTRDGRKVQSYRHYYAADGSEAGNEKFQYHAYAPINGGTYCNFPDPATATPTPDPENSHSHGGH
ncbi:MAG: VanW family protein [Bacillota bacterium]